jgi:hypothetical protein
MCNSILVSPRTLSGVGPVGPVVLHRIWWEQVVPPSGTGGTGVRRAMLPARNGNHDGPTGLTLRSHRKSAELLAVPPVPLVPPGSAAVLLRE